MRRALRHFAKRLHPDDVAAIRAWSKREKLAGLLTDLQKAVEWERFLDHYAEAMVALHLIRLGCELEYEVPTVNRGKADFRVSQGSDIFFAHVKRTNLDDTTADACKRSARLAELRKIRRPVMVSFMFIESLTDQEMQYCCQEGKEFIENADVGDRKVIKDGSGRSLGEFEIDSEHSGRCVRIGPQALPAVDGGYESAIGRQLSHAYRRFMPSHVNVVLITGFWPDDGSIEDTQDALDNFWRGQRHPLSNIVVYFTFCPREGRIEFEPFIRNKGVPPYISNLFEADRR